MMMMILMTHQIVSGMTMQCRTTEMKIPNATMVGCGALTLPELECDSSNSTETTEWHFDYAVATIVDGRAGAIIADVLRSRIHTAV